MDTKEAHIMMDPEIKAKWVEALRSGKYKQGQNYLNKNNEEFCCIGVLCEINPDIAKKEQGCSGLFSYTHDSAESFGSSSVLSVNLCRDFGFTGTNYIFLSNIMSMNDGASPSVDNNYATLRSYSFAEIADYIEQNKEI